jgi:hypothetical protein
VPAEQLIDTQVQVRVGDSVRVEAIGQPLYWRPSNGGEVLLQSGRTMVELVTQSGSVHLRGGVKRAKAKVTVFIRGREWR